MQHDADFVQPRLLRSRQYKLERDGVAVTEKSLISSHRYHIPFEGIPPKAQEITGFDRKWLTAAIVCTAIALIALPILIFKETRSFREMDGVWFWAGVAAICWTVFFIKKSALIIYATERSAFVLYANSPSRQAVDAFIRKLFDARNRYLRSRYGTFTPDEPIAERLNRLEVLRAQEVISEEEYQFMRRQEGSSSSLRQGPIGFK